FAPGGDDRERDGAGPPGPDPRPRSPADAGVLPQIPPAPADRQFVDGGRRGGRGVHRHDPRGDRVERSGQVRRASGGPSAARREGSVGAGSRGPSRAGSRSRTDAPPEAGAPKGTGTPASSSAAARRAGAEGR